jgi:molybdopterin molybdotransferase
VVALIPLASAVESVVERCRELTPRALPLSDCLGRVTAERVVSGVDVPPFANSAMDGYALRASDTACPPVRLQVVDTVAAGSGSRVEVKPGQAVRIMTGAPLPPGADAVVMVEQTSPLDGGAVVVVDVETGRGDHVRQAGDDISSGDEVVGERVCLGPGHLGLLASVGRAEVSVLPRPVVGVLSTGDELVDGSAPLEPGRIHDSNRPSLLATLRQEGFDAVDLGVVPDEEDRISAALESGLDSCDAILTSGGVSVGDFDYVKVVLDRLTRGGMTWMQVAIKPAKPFAFGCIGDKPVFGLPGNPVSSLVSFELLARPGLRKLGGHRVLERPRVLAVADDEIRRPRDGKVHFVRVEAYIASEGRHHVRLAGGQGSHMLSAMARANALAEVPDGDGVMAGETVPILILRGAGTTG